MKPKKPGFYRHEKGINEYRDSNVSLPWSRIGTTLYNLNSQIGKRANLQYVHSCHTKYNIYTRVNTIHILFGIPSRVIN